MIQFNLANENPVLNICKNLVCKFKKAAFTLGNCWYDTEYKQAVVNSTSLEKSKSRTYKFCFEIYGENILVKNFITSEQNFCR